MKKTLFTLSLFGFLLSASAQTDSVVFSFTGEAQIFTVPACVSSITMKAFGAQGANGGGTDGGIGGKGAFLKGTLSVNAGDQFTITVGGTGTGNIAGFNGGGAGGNAGPNGRGGGGGGATVINSAGVGDLLIAGGGGGGGGMGCDLNAAGGNGGIAGGGNGANGISVPFSGGGFSGGGFGAIGSAAGIAGIGCPNFLGADGTGGSSLLGGNGGAGPICCCFDSHTDPSGGGGGGGFVGGGGGGAGSAGTASCSGNNKGAGGGGAGGTNFTHISLTAAAAVDGHNAGNGKVVIVFTPISITMNPNPTAICDNAPSILLVDGSPSGGVWSGNGITANVLDPSFANVGNNTYTYSLSNIGCNLSGTAVISVLGCSGIEEVGFSRFTLFPNPVNNEFTIQSNEGSPIETIQVMDASGRIIFSSKPNTTSFLVETATWATGVYSVRINNVVKTIIKN